MLDRHYDSEYLQRFLKRNLLPMFVALEVWNIIWYILGLLLNSPSTIQYSVKVALFMETPMGDLLVSSDDFLSLFGNSAGFSFIELAFKP